MDVLPMPGYASEGFRVGADTVACASVRHGEAAHTEHDPRRLRDVIHEPWRPMGDGETSSCLDLFGRYA